jgi:hypothetical protein
MTANSIARHLRRGGYDATAVHRDVGKTKKAGGRRKSPAGDALSAAERSNRT